MHRLILIAIATSLLVTNRPATAAEPNNDFSTAQVLGAGILSVAEDLQPLSVVPPDTYLGTLGLFGNVEFVDDDSSPLGNGSASGIGGVPTNSGSIDFVITGFGDEDFSGVHSVSGNYEVFVEVYDFFDDLVDSFSVVRTLAPGVVHSFTYSDFEWLNGSYDVYINNLIDPSGDVDFFRFTGLTAGDAFSAVTLDPSGSAVDTVLGWYDDAGALVDFNDDANEVTSLSMLEGIVPASGELVFAVTGFDDFSFTGVHGEAGAYELRLMTGGGAFAGDANGDGKVDLLDLDILGANFGATSGATNGQGDFNGDMAVNLLDLDILGSNFGNMQMPGVAVPEPAGWALLSATGLAGVLRRRG